MNRQLILCDTNQYVVEDWKKYLKEPFIEVVQGSILEQKADTMVAPGNSFGYMDGGLDLIIDRFFDFKFSICPFIMISYYDMVFLNTRR